MRPTTMGWSNSKGSSKNISIRDEPQEPNRISNGPNIYQIGAEIGRGGFAIVFQAFNVETGDFVAVKRFPLKAIDDDSLSSIESEIELMQKLNHPNIVKYIDTIRTKDYLHIVLEYMENGSLSNVIKKFGSFSESLTAIYVTQVLRGLKYLHEQGVLHRDIKGANILTTKDGMVKLADFGVAMKLSEAHENDQDVVGSPYWIAPEIIEMSAPTAACDIWSVGCIIIELLTRKPPYYDLAPMAALFRIVQDDYPPLPEGISQALRDFLLLCFQKEPAMRSSATKLLEHPWLHNSSTNTNLAQTSKLLASKSKSTSSTDVENSNNADSIVNTIRNYQMEAVIDDSAVSMDSAETISRYIGLSRSSDESSPLKTPKTHTIVPGFGGPISPPEDRKKVPLTTEKASPELFKRPPIPPERPILSNASTLHTDDFDTFDDDMFTAESTDSFDKPSAGFALDEKTTQDITNAVEAVRRTASVDGLQKVSSFNRALSFVVNQTTSSSTGGNLSKYQEQEQDEDNFDDLLLVSESQSQTRPSSIQVATKTTLTRPSSMSLSHSDLNRPTPLMRNLKAGQVVVEVDDFDFDDEDDGFQLDNVTDSTPLQDMASKLRSRMQKSVKETEGDGDLEADEFINYKFDEKDFKQNESKDVHFRRSREVVNIMAEISPETREESVIELCAQLMDIFTEYPEQREHLVTYHGVMPIIDMIEARSVFEHNSEFCTCSGECICGGAETGGAQRKILQPYVLRVVNKIIEGSTRAQEQLSLVGIIPTIMTIFDRSHSHAHMKGVQVANSVDPVTLEAARFIHQISSTSSLTLQMLIGAGGLSVLTSMVSFGAKIIPGEDTHVSELSLGSITTDTTVTSKPHSVSEEDSMSIFQMGIDCITNVFSVQSSRTRDFCRLFVKLGLLQHLSIAFQNVLSLFMVKMSAAFVPNGNNSPSLMTPRSRPVSRDFRITASTLMAGNVDGPGHMGHKKSMSGSSDSSLTHMSLSGEALNAAPEKIYTEQIATLFFKFSRSDSIVAEMMANSEYNVISVIVSALQAPELRAATSAEWSGSDNSSVSQNSDHVRKKSGNPLNALGLHSSYVSIVELLLKCIKNLSMEPSTLQDLEKAGVIETMIPLLSGPMSEKCKNHILPAMFNICRINKRRQEQAAVLGIIPHLKKVIADGSHLRQFALPIIFDLAHASAASRAELWKNDCVAFYLDMLKDNYWQTFSLNSLAIWLSYDAVNVSRLLVEPNKLTKLIEFFRVAAPQTIQSLHKPLYDMILKSKELSRALSCSAMFITALVKKLTTTSEAIVLRSLLKMLQLMHQYHPCPRQLVLDNNLYPLVKDFAQSEGQVLVCQIANRLLRDFQYSTLT